MKHRIQNHSHVFRRLFRYVIPTFGIIALFTGVFLDDVTIFADPPEHTRARTAESLLKWAEYDPSIAITSRVLAQAELIEYQRNRFVGKAQRLWRRRSPPFILNWN
ncbi:MAG: hypothetical protein R3C49_06565 [Planctomycetaceae bacterium]